MVNENEKVWKRNGNKRRLLLDVDRQTWNVPHGREGAKAGCWYVTQ